MKTYGFALSSVSDKEIKLRIDPISISGSSTVEPKLKNKERMGRWVWDVDVVTKQLDDFVCENSQHIKIDKDFYPQPSLVKIDVEGHETEVLRGGVKFLRKCRPVIILEYGGKTGDFEPKSIGILLDEGYAVLDLATFQEVREPYEALLTDLLAIPMERYDKFRPITLLLQTNRG